MKKEFVNILKEARKKYKYVYVLNIPEKKIKVYEINEYLKTIKNKKNCIK